MRKDNVPGIGDSGGMFRNRVLPSTGMGCWLGTYFPFRLPDIVYSCPSTWTFRVYRKVQKGIKHLLFKKQIIAL